MVIRLALIISTTTQKLLAFTSIFVFDNILFYLCSIELLN